MGRMAAAGRAAAASRAVLPGAERQGRRAGAPGLRPGTGGQAVPRRMRRHGQGLPR